MVKKYMARFMIIAMASVAILSFQNCSPASFENAEGLSSADLASMSDDIVADAYEDTSADIAVSFKLDGIPENKNQALMYRQPGGIPTRAILTLPADAKIGGNLKLKRLQGNCAQAFSEKTLQATWASSNGRQIARIAYFENLSSYKYEMEGCDFELSVDIVVGNRVITKKVLVDADICVSNDYNTHPSLVAFCKAKPNNRKYL